MSQETTPQADLRLYLRLLSYARPYWRTVVVSVVSVVIAAAMEPLMPALMKPLIDESLIAKDPTSLWMVPIFLVLVVVLRGLADYVVTVSSQSLAQRTVEDLRAAVFAKQLDLPLSRHDQEQGGRMLTRITYDTQMVADAVSNAWLVFVRDTLVILGLVGFLFYTAWELALFVFVSLPILTVAIQRIGRRLRRSNTRVQESVGRLSGLIQEALMGLKEIKIFGAQGSQRNRFAGLNLGLRKEQMKVVRTSALAGPLVSLLTALTVAVVIYLASFMTAQGSLTPGEFVAFITALAMVFGPMRRLAQVNAVLQKGLAAADAIFGLLDEPVESRSATPSDAEARALQHERLVGEVEFRGVSFRYPHQETQALQHLSFHIAPREVIALVGPSGSGKSTVLYLLAGFAQPQAGEILIDGRSMSEIDVYRLRQNIALVGQRVMLFDDTIRQNILLGRPEASEQEVIAAARAAHAWPFIESLPQGLDTPLGSLGDRLSGGQRQRIAIARAFLKDAPILLLDEATSALDKESEQAVLQGLNELMAGRTVLMVSHAPERLTGVHRLVSLG
ncbi:MAG: lipid export permease/ATP-binding protein MsbA [Pseudomonadota bacterium]|jgi:subfamily B ATP-binding cassette protein MsbA